MADTKAQVTKLLDEAKNPPPKFLIEEFNRAMEDLWAAIGELSKVTPR